MANLHMNTNFKNVRMMFSLLLQFLIEEGANVDEINNDGWNSLMKACHQGHLGVVRVMTPIRINKTIIDFFL